MKGRCPGPARRWGRAVKGVSTAKVPKCQAYVQKNSQNFFGGGLLWKIPARLRTPSPPRPALALTSPTFCRHCRWLLSLPRPAPFSSSPPQYLSSSPTPPRSMPSGRTPFSAFQQGRTRQTHCKFTPAWVISSPCKNLAIHPPAPAALRVL